MLEKSVKIKIKNISELQELIQQLLELTDKLANFKIETEIIQPSHKD